MKYNQIMERLKYDEDYTKVATGKVIKVDEDINSFDFQVTNGPKMTLKLNNWSVEQILNRLKVNVSVKSLQKEFNKPNQKIIGMNRDNVIRAIIKLGIQEQKTRSKVIYDSNKNIARGVVFCGYHYVSNNEVFRSARDVYGSNIDERFSFINDNKMNIFFESDLIKETPIAKEKVVFGRLVGHSDNGNGSLSVFQSLKFLRCTNGLVLTELKFGERIRHTSKLLRERFKTAMDKFLNDFSILDEIDKWYQRPDIIPMEAFTDNRFLAETEKRLQKLLENYKIKGKKHRRNIIDELFKRKEGVNAYRIADAVNYYASNVVEDEEVALGMLQPAFQIMQM